MKHSPDLAIGMTLVLSFLLVVSCATKEDIEDLQNQISDIAGGIRSITYVPGYSDGTTRVSWYYDQDENIVPDDFYLDFNVLPSGSASKIASVWQTALSAEAVYTLTTRSLVEAVPLDVKSVESDGDYLRITLSGANLKDDFYLGQTSASVSVKISDDSGNARTGYLPLVSTYMPAVIEQEIDELSCDYSGGDFSFSYSIENPREGESLQVTCPDPWVTDISVSSDRVSFRVTENQTFMHRQSKLSLSYSNIKGEVPVYQKVNYGKFIDFSSSGTANCYIVSSAGGYKFPTVKGNGNESVGPVSSVGVLWESFGTDVTPQVGDLIPYAEYYDGCVYFSTAENFREGNAVIAARDASGNILWNWHIWLTDRPEDQVYNNGAGTMMDRNLGATSATPGDVGALGLLYQWGRKDPFLGSSSISEAIPAKSTIEWPSPVKSTASEGTIDYAVSNPVTFIIRDNANGDWYYTGSEKTDNTRWQSSKTIYDPCPPGYRVPDGGDNGVWPKAFGSSASFSDDAYDSTNKGFNFGSSGAGTKKLSNSVGVCWYPSAGYLFHDNGSLRDLVKNGEYWSCTCTPDGGINSYTLSFRNFGSIFPACTSYVSYLAHGLSVRCMKE